MRLSAYLPVALALLVAAVLAVLAASASVGLVESRSEIGVRGVLDREGLTWAEVEADGLKVNLTGIAPTEADRFRALSAAGSIVDAARVIDTMQVTAQSAITPPKFSVEILRNDAGVSVIGLIPASMDRDALNERFSRIAADKNYADLLQTANYPVPAGWDGALSFAVTALNELQRAKISVEADQVRITALANSIEAKRELERELNRAAPAGVTLSLGIAAPRPVLTPFTLRFVQDDQGVRFDACSADTDVARARILAAARDAGYGGSNGCTVGMGVPTPRWAEAAERAIAAVARLGGGTVTFSDADVALVAPDGTPEPLFDEVVGELENALPPVFALQAVLPQPDAPSTGPAEFLATLSPEGLVQLRGRLRDDLSRQLTTSFAQSVFVSGEVYVAARLDPTLPANWSTRVLTGLEALGNLTNGALNVTPDEIRITGRTGDLEAKARITQLLADKLGEASSFDIQITYVEQLDPVASIPTPDECEAEIRAIAGAAKIRFEPGSATIDASALGTINDIADILIECGSLKLEIQGHTDSQGREIMNLELSQARAQSVLDELRAGRVLTADFLAKGYGETEPIADNKTEDGREANRRIEFHLIRPKPSVPEGESTLDTLAEPVKEEAETDTTEESAGE